MATYSSTLAWKIPWTEEPGGLQSMGSLRVRHDWATSLSLFTFMHWEKEMATHSSVLAWRIPGTGEPGGLPSVGSHRVGHDWSDLAAAAAYFIFALIFKNKISFNWLWASTIRVFSIRLLEPCIWPSLDFSYCKGKNIFASLSVGNKRIKYK